MTHIPKDILVYTEGEINEWQNVKEAFITSVVEKGKVLYEKGISNCREYKSIH